MARPLKSDADRRTLKIEVRVNLSEKTRIEQNAQNAGQEPSVFLRSLGTGAKPTRTVPTPDREILLKVLAELNMQGSNLNQVARALNRRQDSEQLINIDERLVSHTLHGIDELRMTLMAILTA